MAGCKDCYNNCNPVISDTCTKYTGEEIPALGICYGDPLSLVEKAIIDKLLSALDGTGITVGEVTLNNCTWLKNQFAGKDKTLANLFQLLIDNSCSLKELIEDLTPDPVTFNSACLEGLPANPTSNDVLKSAVSKLCTLTTTIDELPTTYVKIDDLPTLVTTIIQEGSSGVPTYKDRLVPYVAYEYYGSLSNFDNTGKGITALGFEKVYLCNGANGTPDKRGRVAVGAVRNVPGGTLDSAVDPANTSNVQNVNYALKDKFGENFHKQTIAEMPSHGHTVTDPGHDHELPSDIQYMGKTFGGERGGGDRAPDQNKRTGKSSTGITISPTGSGTPFNVRMPAIAAYYIMYIP